MRILFTMLAVGACLGAVCLLFLAAWTNVLISSIVFVLSLMGLEVVRIRETMARPIEQVVQQYLAQHQLSGMIAVGSDDAQNSGHRQNVFKLEA